MASVCVEEMAPTNTCNTDPKEQQSKRVLEEVLKDVPVSIQQLLSAEVPEEEEPDEEEKKQEAPNQEESNLNAILQNELRQVHFKLRQKD